MRAASRLIGENYANFFDRCLIGGLVGFHQTCEIVGIGERDVAFAGGHGIELIGVAANRFARQICHYANRPRFGFFGAIGGDDR